MKIKNMKIESHSELNPNPEYCRNPGAAGGYYQPYYTGTVEVDGAPVKFELEDSSCGDFGSRYNVYLDGYGWSGEFGTMASVKDKEVATWALDIHKLIEKRQE